MNASATIGELATALHLAQGEMPFAPMNAKNPFLKNKYADLGSVIETSRPILAKHGLSIAQFPTSSEDGRIGVRSILMHRSGEFIEDSIFIDPKDSKGLSVAQASGVVITYLRRYSWVAIIGMYADEDNDGELPKEEEKKSAKRTKPEGELTVQERVVGLAKVKKVINKQAVTAAIKQFEPSGNPTRITDEATLLKLEAELNKIQ